MYLSFSFIICHDASNHINTEEDTSCLFSDRFCVVSAAVLLGPTSMYMILKIKSQEPWLCQCGFGVVSLPFNRLVLDLHIGCCLSWWFCKGHRQS